MDSGFPFGAAKELTRPGVFPFTGEDTAGVEASRAELLKVCGCRTSTTHTPIASLVNRMPA